MRWIAPLDRVALAILPAVPPLFAAVRAQALLAARFARGAAFLLGRPAIHAVTLPVGWDASFGKALPVLGRGGACGRRNCRRRGGCCGRR